MEGSGFRKCSYMENVLPAFHDFPPAIRDYEAILGAGASSDVTNE